MRRIIKIILLTSILSIIVGCKKENNNIPALNCGDASFMENYSMNIQNGEVFFIKGIALDMIKYGRNIRVIEDLKGNFTDKTTILVWGEGEGGITGDIESNRWDYMSFYNNNDTLIMLLEKARKRYDGDIEKSGDYATITCAHSILKLSNDSVHGYISPRGERVMWYDNMSQEEIELFVKDLSFKESVMLSWETTPWDELQKKLKNINPTK